MELKVIKVYRVEGGGGVGSMACLCLSLGMGEQANERTGLPNKLILQSEGGGEQMR